MKPSRLRVIGKIQNTFGLDGEVRVKPYDAKPEWVDYLERVYLDKPTGMEEKEIESVRPHGQGLVMKLAGVDTPEQAQALAGIELKAFESDLPSPEEDEYYTDELVGLTVHSQDSERELGTVQEVLSSAAGEFLDVKRPDVSETVLVPFQKVFVAKVDKDAKALYITGLDSFFE